MKRNDNLVPHVYCQVHHDLYQLMHATKDFLATTLAYVIGLISWLGFCDDYLRKSGFESLIGTYQNTVPGTVQ